MSLKGYSYFTTFPSLSQLAGLDIPVGLDGKSLVPIMEDPEATVKEYAVIQYPRRGTAMGYSLRTDQYRYTLWMADNYRTTEPYEDKLVLETELYDYEKRLPGNHQRCGKNGVSRGGGGLALKNAEFYFRAVRFGYNDRKGDTKMLVYLVPEF